MPRRNQNESGRKKSSHSGGGSDSRRQAPRKRTFRKDSENPKSNSGEKPFGNRRSSSSGPSRPDRKSGTGAKPFRKSGKDSGERRSSRPLGGGRSSRDESETRRFSQKSRFSQNISTGPKARGEGDRDEKQIGSKRFGKDSRRSGERPSDKSFSQRSRFPKADSKGGAGKEGAPRESRGGSFGKPYKKVYKSKPVRTGPVAPHRRHQADDSAPKSDKVRLNKFIANSGISSRREADELITMGLISVNGTIVTELGYKVNPGDEVRYESKVLRAEKPVYVLMNKPKGFLTTTEDPQERKTVMQIIGSIVKERIYPVGRLDRNTTGLLLLTNDGDLADKLMHPSFNVKKVYKVELDKPLTKADFQTISEGVRLEEGRATVDDLAIVSDDGRTVGIELHIGWNRVVRRIFERLGYEVIKLDRTAYAGLDKKELARGQWRFLTKEEIIQLKHFK